MLHENRASILNNHTEPVRRVLLQRYSHEQIAKRSQRGVAALDPQPRRLTSFVDDIDDAEVRKITDSHLRDIVQRVFVLEARAKQSSDLCQKALPAERDFQSFL